MRVLVVILSNLNNFMSVHRQESGHNAFGDQTVDIYFLSSPPQTGECVLEVTP